MKYEEICDDLRSKIVRGEYVPGTRIPIREDLLKIYSASKGTLQNAINRLVEEGFLEACGAKGMLVGERPPHLCRIGFSLLLDPKNATESFWSSISLAMNDASLKDGFHSFITYCNAASHLDEAAARRLLDDVRKRRLAGLVSWANDLEPAVFKSLEDASIPAVLFAREDFSESPNVTTVFFDFDRMIEMGVERLAGKGRRRIALLLNAEAGPECLPAFERALEKAGAYTKREWIQAAAMQPKAMPWAANMTMAAFASPRAEAPDGLLTLNENLLPYALDGLAAKGLRPGADLDLVSHCNLPASGGGRAGIERIAFDLRDSVSLAVSAIDEFHKSGRGKGKLLLAPRWVEG